MLSSGLGLIFSQAWLPASFWVESQLLLVILNVVFVNGTLLRLVRLGLLLCFILSTLGFPHGSFPLFAGLSRRHCCPLCGFSTFSTTYRFEAGCFFTEHIRFSFPGSELSLPRDSPSPAALAAFARFRTSTCIPPCNTRSCDPSQRRADAPRMRI